MDNKYLHWVNVLTDTAQILELPLDILIELGNEANLKSLRHIETELKLEDIQDWLLEKSTYGEDCRYIFG
jgi:hypothetical protein